jgi:hypothetical protein
MSLRILRLTPFYVTRAVSNLICCCRLGVDQYITARGMLYFQMACSSGPGPRPGPTTLASSSHINLFIWSRRVVRGLVPSPDLSEKGDMYAENLQASCGRALSVSFRAFHNFHLGRSNLEREIR